MNAHRLRDESGVTFIELVVVIVVSGLFLGLIGMVFINGWTAQQRATERNAATAQLNAVTAAITQSIRSSDVFRVSQSGQRLDARVLGSDGVTWECRAWQIDDGELRYSGGSTARTAVTSMWASLASNIEGNLTSDAGFAVADGRLSVGLTLAQGEVSVAVTNGAVAQVIGDGGQPCWAAE